MERETLMNLIHEGPVRVHMNDGRTYEITKPEFAVVSDWHALLLVRRADGRLGDAILSLQNIASAEPFELADKNHQAHANS